METDNEITPDAKYNAVNDTRKFEINLLWQRSNTFWLFTAAAFGAFFGTYNTNHFGFSVIVSNIGFFCTFCWTLANRGSKFWQRNWENIMAGIDDNFDGQKGNPKKGWFTYRFSVSKLLIICSDYLTVLWILILIGLFYKGYIGFCISNCFWWCGWFSIATIICALLTAFCFAKGSD